MQTTQLYVSFRPADETGHLDVITTIECCITAIRCWMRENKLLLNEEKTEFLLIGTEQQLAKVDIGHIKVGKVNIAPQRVQNAAARPIYQESRFCHITPLLKSLHWLPMKYCMVFKIILITFKAIHDLVPAYISELISVRDTGRYDLRSNDGLLLAPCRGKTLTTLGDRSFHAAAPKLWNDLPGSIRNTQSLNKFKKAIKTLLFAKLFNSLHLILYFYIFLENIFLFSF